MGPADAPPGSDGRGHRGVLPHGDLPLRDPGGAAGAPQQPRAGAPTVDARAGAMPGSKGGDADGAVGGSGGGMHPRGDPRHAPPGGRRHNARAEGRRSRSAHRTCHCASRTAACDAGAARPGGRQGTEPTASGAESGGDGPPPLWSPKLRRGSGGGACGDTRGGAGSRPSGTRWRGCWGGPTTPLCTCVRTTGSGWGETAGARDGDGDHGVGRGAPSRWRCSSRGPGRLLGGFRPDVGYGRGRRLPPADDAEALLPGGRGTPDGRRAEPCGASSRARWFGTSGRRTRRGGRATRGWRGRGARAPSFRAHFERRWRWRRQRRGKL